MVKIEMDDEEFLELYGSLWSIEQSLEVDSCITDFLDRNEAKFDQLRGVVDKNQLTLFPDHYLKGVDHDYT